FQGSVRPVPIRFQHARAGSEALIHAVRAAVEADPRTTVLSIDGVGAYDHISRASMFTALRDLASLASLLPFSMLFYGQASRYSFYDGEGRRHEAAYWASWADTVGALQAHHPDELE
ncbi:unnamed protein product, partial [Symbiodinium pilosum]